MSDLEQQSEDPEQTRVMRARPLGLVLIVLVLLLVAVVRDGSLYYPAYLKWFVFQTGALAAAGLCAVEAFGSRAGRNACPTKTGPSAVEAFGSRAGRNACPTKQGGSGLPAGRNACPTNTGAGWWNACSTKIRAGWNAWSTTVRWVGQTFSFDPEALDGLCGSLWAHVTHILLLSYVALCALSCLWSGVVWVSFLGALAVVFYVGWALLVSHLVRTLRDTRFVCYGVIAAGTAAALAMFVERLRGTEDAKAIVMGHANFLASFLLAPILLSLALLGSGLVQVRRGARSGRTGARSLLRCGALAVGIGGMGWALKITLSMGAYLGLAFGVGTYALIRVGRRARLALLGGVALALLGVCAWLYVPEGRTDQLARRLLRSHQASRLFLLQGSARMIAARPALGWGVGTFMSRWPRHKPVEAAGYGWLETISLHPHNEFVLVAVEVGLVGLILFVAVLAVLIVRAVRLRTAPSPREEGQAVLAADSKTSQSRAALVAALCAMLFHGIFTVSLRFWGPAAMFWTLVGLLLRAGAGYDAEEGEAQPAAAKPRNSDTEARTGRAAGVAAPLAVGLVCALVWGLAPLRGLASEYLLGRALTAQRKGAAAAAASLYERGLRLSMYGPSRIVCQGRLGDCFRDVGDLDRAIDAYEDLQGLAPGLWRSQLTLGELYLKRSYVRQSTSDARVAAKHLSEFVRFNPNRDQATRLLRAARKRARVD